MFRQLWDDITGEKQRDHPAFFPVELAERLVRMSSFVGNRVVDPFAGTGVTAVAASRCGRHPVSVELGETHVDIAEQRIDAERGMLTNCENLPYELL